MVIQPYRQDSRHVYSTHVSSKRLIFKTPPQSISEIKTGSVPSRNVQTAEGTNCWPHSQQVGKRRQCGTLLERQLSWLALNFVNSFKNTTEKIGIISLAF